MDENDLKLRRRVREKLIEKGYRLEQVGDDRYQLMDEADRPIFSDPLPLAVVADWLLPELG